MELLSGLEVELVFVHCIAGEGGGGGDGGGGGGGGGHTGDGGGLNIHSAL